MKIITTVYKSSKQDELYLYVERANGLDGLDSVPQNLMDDFGEPQEVMTLLLTKEKKLARVETLKVMQDIQQKGFYLQLPPAKIIQATIPVKHKVE